MWHYSDYEERRKRILPSASLDIYWLTIMTKQDITEAFYATPARERACQLPECTYKNSSSTWSPITWFMQHIVVIWLDAETASSNI